MSWFRVDDKFAFHAKAVRAGNAAIGVWVRLGAWSSDQLTDGKLPGEIAKVIQGPDVGTLDRLCEVGLLEREGENYAMHDFLDWNPSGKQVKRQRKELSEARSKAGSKGVAKREANRKQTASPSPSPDPIPIPEEKRDPPTPKIPEGFKLTKPDPSPASPATKPKRVTSEKAPKKLAEDRYADAFEAGQKSQGFPITPLAGSDKKLLGTIAAAHARYRDDTPITGKELIQWFFQRARDFRGDKPDTTYLRGGSGPIGFRTWLDNGGDGKPRPLAPGQEEPDEDDEDLPPPDEDLPPGYVEPPREELIATLERHGLHVGAQVLRETGKQAAHG